MILSWTGAALLLGWMSEPATRDDVDRFLTGKLVTDHFVIHYRPGSRAGASVDYVAARAEREFDEIADALDIDPDGSRCWNWNHRV